MNGIHHASQEHNIKVKRQPRHNSDLIEIDRAPLSGRNSTRIKIIVFTTLIIYLILVVLLAILTKQYAILTLLIFLFNVVFLWFFGRMATKLMLFPNSNFIVSSIMNRVFYKKVTQELIKLSKYVSNVMLHIQDGREFEDEREYDKYVQDLAKGVEMLNLLLEANLYHKKLRNGRVGGFFNDVTNRMQEIRRLLSKVKLYNPEEEESEVNEFYHYDFTVPIYTPAGHPRLPKFMHGKENEATVAEARNKINELNDLLERKIMRAKCCTFSPVFCYSEQLEYILSYNYNAIKFEAPNLYDSHKVPMMFFPAHGKHLQLDREVIKKYGKNVTVSFDPAHSECVTCTCTANDRPTIMLCNPNALCYEQMVNYPHNFWLKYFMNHGNNVVVWNYRGYGCAKGSPDPYNIKRDGEAVIDFCMKHLNLKGKFAVYGRSLGGIVACHIANHVRGIDFVFVDRTLSNLEILTKKKMNGIGLHHAFNFFSCGWEVDNDRNFLESEAPCKILTCDPSDDVIDIYSSLYSGVACRYLENERGLTTKIDVSKYPLFFQNDIEFFSAMKKYFEIYSLLAHSLKERDVLTVSSKVNAKGAADSLNDIKREPLSTNKNYITKSRASKEYTKQLANQRYVHAREALERDFAIHEKDYFEAAPSLLHNFILPFRNTFSSLNGGILTLYEVLHVDRKATLEDIKLFIIFLEVYGTGRALKPSGEYVSLSKRRRNSCKKLDSIITELEEIFLTEVDIGDMSPRLYSEAKDLSKVILNGFRALKKYLDEKLERDDLDDSSKCDDVEMHRINGDSDDKNSDLERALITVDKHSGPFSLEKRLGYIIPMRCGHRGYPKEKEKEKKAMDILLFNNGFRSQLKCDSEDDN